MNETQRWYALHTKARHEFIASGELREKGIETFLPSIKRISQWKDRKKVVAFPLFPGYLFVHISLRSDEFLTALRARGVVTFISLEKGIPTPLAAEEISSLRGMIESGQDIDIYPQLREGTRVRVRKGPLVGAVGTLVRKEDNYVFAVNIEILGRSVGVKIYPDDLEEA